MANVFCPILPCTHYVKLSLTPLKGFLAKKGRPYLRRREKRKERNPYIIQIWSNVYYGPHKFYDFYSEHAFVPISILFVSTNTIKQ